MHRDHKSNRHRDGVHPSTQNDSESITVGDTTSPPKELASCTVEETARNKSSKVTHGLVVNKSQFIVLIDYFDTNLAEARSGSGKFTEAYHPS